MANTKTVKCRYKYCRHESKDIDREEAVKVGSSYYHADCHKESENKKKVVDLFHDHINPNPVYSQLNHVIQNIVHEKNVSAEYLAFALQYYINHKIPLNYPQGLYYVIQNKEAKKAWDKQQVKEKQEEFVFDMNSAEETEFTYRPTKQKGFGSILGG